MTFADHQKETTLAKAKEAAETAQATTVVALTLDKGRKVGCAFGELDVMTESRMFSQRRRIGRMLYDQYTGLHDLESDARQRHEDFPAYEAEHEVKVRYGPTLRACWDGEGDPPTDEEIGRSKSNELWACLKECVRHNPQLADEFPYAAEMLAAEGVDPND